MNPARERRVVRVPNHLGDLVMAMPALRAAPGGDLVAVRWLVPLLELAREGDLEAGASPAWQRVVLLDGGAAGLLRAAGALRRERYAAGVLLTPSLSSALLFSLGRVRHLRGTATDARSWLLHQALAPERFQGVHRSAMYWELMTGSSPEHLPVPQIRVPARQRNRWAELAGQCDGPRVGIFPGSNASSRRWDAARFASVARGLADEGAEVVVFGGPGERVLTSEVAGHWARDLGGRTDLGLLAAGLASCDLVLSNDSGPLHLAAAVGANTVSLWGAGDPSSTGVHGVQHQMLRRADLPCVPCVKNQCPRSGAGYHLADAERECLRLIAAPEVEAVVREKLIRNNT